MNDDLKIGSIALALSAFLWFYAIPFHIKGALPALLPRCLTLSMMIPCVIFFYKGIVAARRGEKSSSVQIIPGVTFKAILVIPMMLVYTFLIEIIGFYVITCLFVFIFLLFFGARRSSFSLYLFPVAISFIVYIVIGRILHFPFPDGFFF